MSRPGRTGHAEAVRVVFDPTKLSYADLLEKWFFKMHDPTTLNRQGNDVGTQYRSAIFVTSPEQRQVAEEVKARVDKSGKWKRPIVTEIVDAGPFTPRGGVPPGLPAEASRRLHLPLHARVARRGGEAAALTRSAALGQLYWSKR